MKRFQHDSVRGAVPSVRRRRLGPSARLAVVAVMAVWLWWPLRLSAQSYPVPSVPDTIVGTTARADYATAHFWDAYDFCDTTLAARPSYAEQAVSDFVALLGYASPRGRADAVARWLRGAARCTPALSRAETLAAKYLHDRRSPLRSDSLYALVLTQLQACPGADAATRGRAADQLRLLRRNAVGTVATDFSLTTADGHHCRLHDVVGPGLTLLLLYDPDCGDCRDAVFRLKHSGVLNRAISEQRLRVLAVYAGDDRQLWLSTRADMPANWTVAADDSDVGGHALYDVSALPVGLLLAADGRVLLRSVDVQRLSEAVQSFSP